MDHNRIVGIAGGTGPAGSGLAVRLAAAGHTVLLGSRDRARAQERVAELRAAWPGRNLAIEGMTNAEAVRTDVVLLAAVADSVPTLAREHAPALDDRVVVSMANLLHRTPRGFAADLPTDGSVALAVQRSAPRARVVGAFQNLPAAALGDLDRPLDADVLVCGNDSDAVTQVLALTDSMAGLRGIDAGPLANAAGVEALTAILLTVNRARRGEHSVKLVDLDGRAR